jgi:L-lactate dehydrogenase complex protein LldG
MATLLGADVVSTDLASLADIVRQSAAPELGPIAISADLASYFPELAELDSRKRDGGSASWWTAITRARIGIAATGSVLIAETSEDDRLLPMLARRHVVLLPAGSILPALADAASVLRALMSSGVRYSTFVSGPSRTADIEKILTIGAHGPQQLIVIVVDGWEPGSDRPVP